MNPRQKPLPVSPLIKFFRWSLLSAGIVCGLNKLALYRAYDKNLAMIRHQQHEKDKEMLKLLSRQQYEFIIEFLAPLFGYELPPDWKKSV